MEMDSEDMIEERRVTKEQLKFDREKIAEERVDKVTERAALTKMIASAIGGYFGVQEKGKRKRKRKRKTKNQKGRSTKRVNMNTDGSGSSSSDTSSIE